MFNLIKITLKVTQSTSRPPRNVGHVKKVDPSLLNWENWIRKSQNMFFSVMQNWQMIAIETIIVQDIKIWIYWTIYIFLPNGIQCWKVKKIFYTSAMQLAFDSRKWKTCQMKSKYYETNLSSLKSSYRIVIFIRLIRCL